MIFYPKFFPPPHHLPLIYFQTTNFLPNLWPSNFKICLLCFFFTKRYLAIDEINANADLLPEHWLVGAHQDTQCSGSGAIKAVIAHQLALGGGEPDVIIGGGCSGGCQVSERADWNVVFVNPQLTPPYFLQPHFLPPTPTVERACRGSLANPRDRLGVHEHRAV